MGADFRSAQDTLHPTKGYVAALLERGIKVLIYVGSYDWICNWVGNERLSLALEWTGKDAFGAAPLRDFEVDGSIAGRARSFGAFTALTVDGAGHSVSTANI